MMNASVCPWAMETHMGGVDNGMARVCFDIARTI